MKTMLLSLLILFLFNGQKADEMKYFTSFDGTKIAYTDEGKGEPVILLHGFISDGSSLRKAAVRQQLLDEGYRLIIPDLRGNGQSDKPREAKFYKKDAEIKDIKALADRLKLSEYSAVGYSRGAIVLAKLLTKDKRISQAVIGGMGLDFTNPKWDRRMKFADAFSGRLAPDAMTEGAINYAKSIGADLKILGLLQDYQPVTSKNKLAKIKIPVLILAGELDTDNGSPAALQKNIPGSRLVLIPGGDHNNTYKGEEFGREVVRFLNGDK